MPQKAPRDVLITIELASKWGHRNHGMDLNNHCYVSWGRFGSYSIRVSI